ncbi:MAG: hypothetical protein GQ563_04120 [Desulfuromusa sp.]|nr:hypothetical protein [Desulfuromusa sp.]
MRILLHSTLLLLLVCSPAMALNIPQPTGYVNDKARIISPTVELKLEQFLRDFEKSDSTQVTVLTIPTLDGEVLEEYSLKVFENWKIGQKGKDNGALLLIAKTEKEIRIEVGYGLEGLLTDLLAGRIIDNEISPKFKRGDFDGGIGSGVVSIAEAVRGEYTGTGKTRSSKKKSSPFGLIFLFFFLGPFISRLTGRRSSRHSSRSRRGGIYLGGPFSGGGGFGGGGFSGGGGGGGGGGASGGW